MTSPLSRAERNRQEAARFFDLAKSASSPFLRGYYWRLAERYLELYERVDAEREGFAVLAEVHNADDEDARLRISREITARVNSQVGHAPREVRLFPAGSLPKTASGKLRRDSARELLSQACGPSV